MEPMNRKINPGQEKKTDPVKSLCWVPPITTKDTETWRDEGIYLKSQDQEGFHL